MESILVDTAQLESKAGEVDGLAGEYLTLYKDLMQLVTEFTSSDYKGEEADAFRTQVEGFSDDFDKMRDLMLEYSDFLKGAARKYDEAKSNNIGIIKSLQN